MRKSLHLSGIHTKASKIHDMICYKEHSVNYKTRLLLEIGMGIIFSLVVTFTVFQDRPLQINGLIFAICVFVFMAEGIFMFNRLLEKKYTWHTHMMRRLLMLVGFTVVWFVVILKLSLWAKPLIDKEVPFDENLFALSVIIGIMYVIIYVISLIAYNYHRSLQEFRIENERLKKEKLELDYRALQDQINPHFLFNNLSTLIAIIRTDQKSAIRFTENFSDVYRYVLQSKDKMSVKLEEEMAFIEAYLALHQERLGEGLKVELSIDPLSTSKELPVLALQFLVENAIKHNMATLSSPLHITIQSSEKYVRVTNSLNHKKSTYSTNTGLTNLEQRISFLTDQPMKVSQTDTHFTVELPLI